MNSRERLLTALNHQEPDRVPYDLGSNQVTGIHVVAYRALRQALDLPPVEPHLSDTIQQLALPDDDLLRRLGADVRGLFPLNSHNWHINEEDQGDHWAYRDEWGITHHRMQPAGLYYSVARVPLDSLEVTPHDIERHPWPNLADPQRIAGLRRQAEAYRAAGYAVLLKDAFAGIFEFAQRIVGMQNCLMMMITNRPAMDALFAKLLELKLAYWQLALPQLADVIDVISYADDYGTQVSQLISPKMFREQIKPLLAVMFDAIKRLAPRARLFFHSDGNIRPLLPDFLELGVDILNPVQFTAAGMDLADLKQTVGRDFAFWGAGVDTQGLLPSGTPQQIKDQVRRNIEILAPGGGYVFNTIHNIQADVPPPNIIAMWEALQEYGVY